MVKIIAATVLVLIVLAGGFYFVSSTNKGEVKQPLEKIIPLNLNNPTSKTSKIQPTAPLGSVNDTDTLDSDILNGSDDISTITDFNDESSVDNLDTDVIALTQ